LEQPARQASRELRRRAQPVLQEALPQVPLGLWVLQERPVLRLSVEHQHPQPVWME
jgi:hypothetical protein